MHNNTEVSFGYRGNSPSEPTPLQNLKLQMARVSLVHWCLQIVVEPTSKVYVSPRPVARSHTHTKFCGSSRGVGLFFGSRSRNPAYEPELADL